MSTVVVTGTFTVAWDTDDYRLQWDEPELSDEEILKECLASVNQDWADYAINPDTVDVFGEISA